MVSKPTGKPGSKVSRVMLPDCGLSLTRYLAIAKQQGNNMQNLRVCQCEVVSHGALFWLFHSLPAGTWYDLVARGAS